VSGSGPIPLGDAAPPADAIARPRIFLLPEEGESSPPVVQDEARPKRPEAMEDGAPGTGDDRAGEGAPPPPRGPALLEVPEGMDAGPVDHGWAPGTLAPRKVPPGPMSWIAGGLAILLLGWVALAAAAFVQDQFARTPANGWVTLGVFGAGLAMLGWGVWLEVRAWRRLRGVEALRAALSQDDDAPVGPARTLALDWLAALDRLPEAAAAHPAVAAAPDLPLLRAALRAHLAAPLRGGSRRLGNRAAVQGGVLVAISPSPALDGLLAGLRGMSLIRQVAALHGLRPGGAVMLALLRRVVWTAAGTSGADLLGQTVAEGALAHLPVLNKITAAVPGASLAALRLRRLADVTAKACSPF